MASLLRQIVAGPRSRHPEAGLDLCYVTDQLIATSGPSGTYPQRAYRNPLDHLVKFLDYKHGEEWSIWEFRAEGTGYPDSEVRGKVRHYPWPDHHPPPFKLVPLIMGSMRSWMAGERGSEVQKVEKGKRVVVVHCKAGKGRSGTMACSYLISECGWKPSEALARFTERRMRPGFGQGVSIPSQLRWVGYVDRWTKSGKVYVERQIEILEVHAWGLRDGVKVQVEGFVDEGKTIKVFHVFTKNERVVVEGGAPGGDGLKDMISDMAGFKNQDKIPGMNNSDALISPGNLPRISTSMQKNAEESGGSAVIFKPFTRVILPSSDINIDFERRNKASMGWTMVTSVAHVWFNAFFEGSGPENNGNPDDNGVFEIDWDKLDGIKGSSRKGTRALDRLAVVWKAYEPAPGVPIKDVIREPGIHSPIPQMEAADWKGHSDSTPSLGKDLGLRNESPTSADISKASSIKSSSRSRDEREDDDEIEGVRISGPAGDENLGSVAPTPTIESRSEEPSLKDVNARLNTTRATMLKRGSDSPQPHSTSSPPPLSNTPTTNYLVSNSELPDAKAHNIGHMKSIKKIVIS